MSPVTLSLREPSSRILDGFPTPDGKPEGARLDEIIHTLAAPPDLLSKPYLRTQ